MSAYLALAASVGLLAVLDTWLFFGPLATTLVAGLVWTSFIAWGCHYHSGGGVKGTTTAIVCMSWGAIVGMCAVMLASGPLAGLGAALAPAIAVGIGATVICLSSKVPFLETIPATAAIIPTILAVVIGAAFGYVSEMLANALTKKGGPSAEATADPEHA